MYHDTNHKVELKPLITLRPKYGMRMKLERRKWKTGSDSNTTYLAGNTLVQSLAGQKVSSLTDDGVWL
jgi:hypothetical protein